MQNLTETPDEKEFRLQREAALGDRYKEAYEGLFRDFISEAQARLFDAFKQTNPEDRDRLQVIRLQLAAYSTLENHLRTYVDTGNLANIELQEFKNLQ